MKPWTKSRLYIHETTCVIKMAGPPMPGLHCRCFGVPWSFPPCHAICLDPDHCCAGACPRYEPFTIPFLIGCEMGGSTTQHPIHWEWSQSIGNHGRSRTTNSYELGQFSVDHSQGHVHRAVDSSSQPNSLRRNANLSIQCSRCESAPVD